MAEFLTVEQGSQRGPAISVITLEDMHDGREGISLEFFGADCTRVEVCLSDDQARQLRDSLTLMLFRRWQYLQQQPEAS